MKGRGVYNALWKLVTQANSRREECHPECVCRAVGNHDIFSLNFACLDTDMQNNDEAWLSISLFCHGLLL